MRKNVPGRSHQLSLAEAATLLMVAVPVPSTHPLLVLKKKLNWSGVREVIIRRLGQAGCNVAHGSGRPLDVDLYVPLLVLQLLKNLPPRQMEEYLAENAAARAFIGWDQDTRVQVRDHSNIARVMSALGADGVEELNGLVLREAASLGLADISLLSADTTAQELPIGYPNEPGILKGLAERCQRALAKLRGKGKRKLSDSLERCKDIVRKVKESHLFAKTKQHKERLLRSMMRQTQKLVSDVEALCGRLGSDSERVVVSATKQLQDMAAVARRLLPQIKYWLKTGFVAKGKLLHAGLTQARAIVRNKAGKKVEFGLQYLINVVGGGYLYGNVIIKPMGESRMPRESLAAYRRIFGADRTPRTFVYDRGGWSEENVEFLRKQRVSKIGIQPRGKAKWQVGPRDRRRVLSVRGSTEGRIGNLKSAKYGFNKPRARREASVHACGQRSILSFNLNKFVRDITRSPTLAVG